MLSFLKSTARSQITLKDWEFVSRVLSKNQQDQAFLFNLLTDLKTQETLLENPTLVNAIQAEPLSTELSLNFYFYVSIFHALKQGGLGNHDLADYITRLLIHGLTLSPEEDLIKPLHVTQPIVYVIDVLQKMEEAKPPQEFYISLQLANYTLLMTSMFPDFLLARAYYKSSPSMPYYENVGSFYYQLANEHYLSEKYSLQEVLNILAEQFSSIRLLLNKLRAQYYFL